MRMLAADDRIYQIEYAFKAAQGFGQTSIAIRGKDSVVVCTEKKVPDAMIVANSFSHVFNIADDIGVVIVKNMNDARCCACSLPNSNLSLFTRFRFKCSHRTLRPTFRSTHNTRVSDPCA